MAVMVSGKSVAMGFSQKIDLPAAAHFMIWSAWKDEGEQIHTASTSLRGSPLGARRELPRRFGAGG
jgi:hypothetical protein